MIAAIVILLLMGSLMFKTTWVVFAHLFVALLHVIKWIIVVAILFAVFTSDPVRGYFGYAPMVSNKHK